MSEEQQSVEEQQSLKDVITTSHVTLLKNLKDTHLSLSVLLREMKFPLGKLLALTPGSFLQFKDSLNEPAEVIVNKKKIARGKVVQKGKRYGIRLDEFLT